MKKFIFIFLMYMILAATAQGAPIMIRSAAEVYLGHNVGVVYINEKIVMRLYAKGNSQSPYGRSIEIVKRIRDAIKAGADIKNIKVMKGTTATVGILGNREIFRVYEEDVKANASMPESLAYTWKNNIEKASEIKIEDIKKEIESSVKKISGMTSEVSGEILQGILDKRALDVTSDSTLSKVDGASFFASPGVSSFMAVSIVLMLFIFIVLIILVVLQVKRLKLQKSGIVGHASGEELENVISHLLTEIDDKSENLTFEFKQKMDALQLKLEEAERKMSEINTTSNTIASADNDDSVIEAIEVNQKSSVIEKTEDPVVKEDDIQEEDTVPVIDRSKHTKQDIIFDMSDKGASVTDIAKKLGIGTGEVQLILDLRR